MKPTQFNSLKNEEKWNIWEKVPGRWLCKFCGIVLSDGPKRAQPFPSSTVNCDHCDGKLTRRTGGGMGDKFNWVLENIDERIQ